MRKWAMLGVGLLVAGAFAAGNAVPKLKHPWAGQTLSQPCQQTLLEWKVATGGVRKDPNVVLTPIFEMTAMSAEVKPRGLVVTVQARRRKGVVHPFPCKGWCQSLRDACAAIHTQAVRRYGSGTGPGTPFHKWNGLAVILYVEGNLSMKAISGHFDHVPWPDSKREVGPRSKE